VVGLVSAAILGVVASPRIPAPAASSEA